MPLEPEIELEELRKYSSGPNFCFQKPLVVGYKGEIGSFILGGLLKIMPKASEIYCFDINETYDEKLERITKAQDIFLCVPFDKTKDFFMTWYPHLSGKRVFEQTSLKYPLYQDKQLKKYTKNIKLLSMHILFRPSATPNIKEERSTGIIGPNWKWNYLHWSLTKLTNSRIVLFDNYIKHDSQMAYQQALIHRILLVSNSLLGENSNNRSYLGNQIKNLSDRICAGDYHLYDFIQSNKYLKPALKKFENEMKKFKTNQYFPGGF